MIEILCVNNSTRKSYPLGTSLLEIIKDNKIENGTPFLGARVNNEIKELSYEIFKPKTIQFFDINDIDGRRMYTRSLLFVLLKAAHDLYPEKLVKLEHSISKGYYCEIAPLSKDQNIQTSLDIGNRMREIIDANLPFLRDEIPTKEAIEIFEKNNFVEKAKLFKNRTLLYTSIYKIDEYENYFYGQLVPSTGYLEVFDLVPYFDGMLLQVPKFSNPHEVEELILQPKLFEILQEYKQWGKVLGVSNICSINDEIEKGTANELIKISEALHEKKVAQIADRVYHHKDKTKLVLIAGPSSSGKTTFCMRLAVQLKVAGLKPIQISLDNYFVDRELTPRDENGHYDFETIDALDIKQFNEDMLNLMSGNEIKVPHFSFEKGARYYNDETMKMTDENILLVEGIHGLNPKLTAMIQPENKFKIYVSALTQVGIDWHNRIPTTDNRLIRRIIRDYQYRHYSALETLRRWPSVRRGEDKYIFPFQEEADIMFNSALLFELGVLKRYVEPLLEEIQQIEPEYSEAQRLLKFFSYFKVTPDNEIPPTSILREFLSGSSFHYA